MIFHDLIPLATKYENGNIVLTVNSGLDNKVELQDYVLKYNKYTPNIIHQYDRIEKLNKTFNSLVYFKDVQLG